jgi:hypothetical protein
MQARVESLETIGEQEVHALPVGRGKEDVLLMIAAQRDVVRRTGDVKPQRPGHGSTGDR